MNNLGTVTLETSRLLLRKITSEDAKEFYENISTDDKIIPFVMWNKSKCLDDTRKVIDIWLDQYKEYNSYRWVVTKKDTEEIIGIIDLVKINLKHKICEVGYCYSSKYWGSGYASEALTKVINFLLNDVGFDIVTASHLESNPNSGKVMIKAGMMYEATLKSRYINKNTNQRENLLVYSITK